MMGACARGLPCVSRGRPLFREAWRSRTWQLTRPPLTTAPNYFHLSGGSQERSAAFSFVRCGNAPSARKARGRGASTAEKGTSRMFRRLADSLLLPRRRDAKLGQLGLKFAPFPTRFPSLAVSYEQTGFSRRLDGAVGVAAHNRP